MKPQYDGQEAPSGSSFGCDSYTCPKCNGRRMVSREVVIEKSAGHTLKGLSDDECTNCNGEGVVND